MTRSSGQPHTPKDWAQLEAEDLNLLKLVFWAALLAPVVLVPAYYLLVALRVAPRMILPS
ncbi:MAG: hypothetical protein JRN57_00475 [Nitrososphaerota archaeon]|nr:hypothetical protein [Nitrososphaerota archaeon]